jgi:type I restriction enzyme, S subunit
MSDWKLTTIGELCDAGLAQLQTGPFGSQLHAHDYVHDGVAVIPTEAIRGRQIDHSVLPKITSSKAKELERHRLRKADILFARRGVQATGHIGCIREAEDGFICGTGAIRLRLAAGNTISADFISHVLANPASIAWFKFHAIGATMPNLNETIIRSFPFKLPPFGEQKAIALILSAFDDKIDLNRRMNETLEAMARAIFKDWFVDFGPTRAKMEGGAPYLGPEIWSLFPDRLDDEGNPEGWLTTRWGELISLEYGKSLTGYDGAAEPYPVFGTNGQIGFHSKPLCPHPGIIVGRKGAYRGVHYCDQPFFVIDTAFYVEPRERAVDLRWAYYEMLRLGINNMDSGSVIPSTSRADFYSLPVLYPQFDVQQAFVRLLSPFWERQKQCDQECKTLAALRDALLPKLMSGEIRPREAKKAIEAVA